MRRLGILSLGVVVPVLFRVTCYFFMYAVAAHQLHRAGLFAYGIPVYVLFSSFPPLNFLPNLRLPVVVAFGHPLPFCGFLLFHGAAGQFFGMTSCINFSKCASEALSLIDTLFTHRLPLTVFMMPPPIA
jgi:hypothetical protein